MGKSQCELDSGRGRKIKRAFATEKEAERFAKDVYKRNANGRKVKLYPYECRHCDSWHLTSLKPRDWH